MVVIVSAFVKNYLPYYKRNLKIAFPVMLTQLGASLVGLFDTIMVGHYATADLAAVSFSNAIFFTVMVFAMGVLMGLTPLVGYEVGKMGGSGNEEKGLRKIGNLFYNGVVVAAELSVVMCLVLGSIYPILDKFGQDPEVIEAAKGYYLLITISIVPFLFFCLQKQFLEGLGNTWVAMTITLVMNLLNIFLNWVFIFGHFGLEPMGATGAGLATLVSRLLMPICFFVVIACHRQWKEYLKGNRINKKVMFHLIKIGTPIGLQTFLETFTFTISFVLIGWISKEALGAHQIANQIADLTFMLAIGIGAATTIRVSHQLGQGDLEAVRMASNASIHLCLMMNTIGATLMIVFRNVIPALFTEDAEVISIASKLILFAGLFQYADGMQTVGAAMLRGLTDVKKPMKYAFIAYILIALPIGIICTFPLKMGAMGMWIGFIVGLSLAAVFFHVRFRRRLRKLETKIAKI